MYKMQMIRDFGYGQEFELFRGGWEALEGFETEEWTNSSGCFAKGLTAVG